MKNKKLFNQAKKYLVGGVNSPVRAFNYVTGNPIFIKQGKGSKVYDYDNKKYIDYVLSWGSLILGHSNKEIVTSVKNILDQGFSFGMTNAKEIELAKLINSAIPVAQKIRFVNSGTEAVMAAIRLARGYTGRDKIVKFTNSYHGHADSLLAGAGSGLATLNIPLSKGVPYDFIKNTIVIPANNLDILEKVFKKTGSSIAAVLIEPVGGNYGVLKPDTEFLKSLRGITKKYNALLISDEIITGFRFNFGSFTNLIGIEPDLICLGKIIGGGLPIGAYAGKTKIMNNLSPCGEVYQASTFSGNPVVMQAGLTTLTILEKHKKDYSRLGLLTQKLVNGLKKIDSLSNRGLTVNFFGSMFSLKFAKKKYFQEFYQKMLSAGIFFAPSEFEANFISFAHTSKDIDQTIKAAVGAFCR